MTAAHTHRQRLGAVFLLTVGVLVLELVGSVLTNSLALLADAGHVFTDVVGIGLGLRALPCGPPPPTCSPRSSASAWPWAPSGSRRGRRIVTGRSGTCGSRSWRRSSMRGWCLGARRFSPVRACGGLHAP